MTRQTKSADTLEKGITHMIEAMQEDYRAWNGDANNWQTVEYRDGFTVGTGRKYARVVNQNTVKAFVVLTDTDKKFQRGDILKPAGYAAPARNSARGNVLRGGYEINWTGPLYL
jgi:hypothetical protein|tara:strand:- start:11526 stop:11867 length:342 start_codon:yes stop_codon:yes gene_type:complete